MAKPQCEHGSLPFLRIHPCGYQKLRVVQTAEISSQNNPTKLAERLLPSLMRSIYRTACVNDDDDFKKIMQDQGVRPLRVPPPTSRSSPSRDVPETHKSDSEEPAPVLPSPPSCTPPPPQESPYPSWVLLDSLPSQPLGREDRYFWCFPASPRKP